MASKLIKTKIAGVSKKNPDGSSRQALLKECLPGQNLILRREPDNPFDSQAVMVLNQEGEQLGYLNSELAEDLAPRMDGGEEISAMIMDITGGTKDKRNLGCNIEIMVGKPDSAKESKKIGCLGYIIIFSICILAALIVIGFLVKKS